MRHIPTLIAVAVNSISCQVEQIEQVQLHLRYIWLHRKKAKWHIGSVHWPHQLGQVVRHLSKLRWLSLSYKWLNRNEVTWQVGRVCYHQDRSWIKIYQKFIRLFLTMNHPHPPIAMKWTASFWWKKNQFNNISRSSIDGKNDQTNQFLADSLYPVCLHGGPIRLTNTPCGLVLVDCNHSRYPCQFSLQGQLRKVTQMFYSLYTHLSVYYMP